MSGAGGAGEARGEAGGARTRLAVGRSRLMAVAWLGALGGTIGLGVLGQARPVADAVAPEVGAVVPGRATPTPVRATPIRPAVDPAPSRPPIGEDGVMGGLPFGTAWLWLERGPASGEATPD